MSLGQYVGFRSPPNQMRQAAARQALARLRGVWPAPGLKDTDLSERGPWLVCRAICDLTNFAAVSAE